MQSQRGGRVRAEVKLPLILIHTPYGLKFFDRVAKSPVARTYAKFNIYMMPLITALAVYLIVGSLVLLAGNSNVRESASSLGPRANLLIPVVNPYIPIWEGLIGLFVTIVIHEAGHGIIARVYNLKVESTGILLFLGIPIGAFVNIERDELMKATLKQKSAVLTAGPLNNIILAILALIGMYFIIASLTPIPVASTPQYGVTVVGVIHGGPADSIGMTSNSTIQSVNGVHVSKLNDLTSLIVDNCGQSISIQWLDSSGKSTTRSVQLPEKDDTGNCRIGVSITPLVANPQLVLDNYKSLFTTYPLGLLIPPTISPTVVPFSSVMAGHYVSPIGPAYAPIANLLFWLWFINLNVGIFNALPIGPLDGGQLYSSIIQGRTKSQALAKNASMLLTYITVGVVLAGLLIPYIDSLPTLASSLFK